MRGWRPGVQVDRRTQKIRDEAGVREKFGVEPRLIPDYLALVGDSADGYPGLPGIGSVTAARLLNRHGPLEQFPADVLGDKRDPRAVVQDLGDAPHRRASLFTNVDALRWTGPTPAFADFARRFEDPRLEKRAAQASAT